MTLDLGGHYLYYPGTPTSNVGVYVHNAGNVIIQNGIIAVFTYGVYFDRGTALNSGNIVQNLRLTNVTVVVVLFTVAGSIVRNNQIASLTAGSGTGIYISGSGGNLVSGNVISGFSDGVFGGGGNYFLENMVSNCTDGFFVSATDKYRFNTTFNCTLPFSGGTALTDENN